MNKKKTLFTKVRSSKKFRKDTHKVVWNTKEDKTYISLSTFSHSGFPENYVISV